MPGKSWEFGNLVPENFSHLERNFSVPNKEIHKKKWETLIMFPRNYTFFPVLPSNVWHICVSFTNIQQYSTTCEDVKVNQHRYITCKEKVKEKQ